MPATSGPPQTLFVGGQSRTHAQIIVLKHFVCATGGTFDLLLRVRLDFTDFSTAGTWSAVGGTGAYEGLHGSGSITGTNTGSNSILDVYAGSMAVN